MSVAFSGSCLAQVGVGHFFLYIDAHPGINSTRVWQSLGRYVEEGVVTLVDWTVKYMLDLRQPTR